MKFTEHPCNQIPEEGLGAPTSIQDRRGPNYVQLMRVIYNFASTASTSSGILSGYLSQKLFVTLSSDCLSFLAGVWLHSFDIPQLRYSALRHSTAFLEAYVSLGCCVDFQTTLPSVLVMVGDEDPKVRGAAVECLEAIVRVSSIETRKPSGVYAFDAIYGVTSSKTTFLSAAITVDNESHSKIIYSSSLPYATRL